MAYATLADVEKILPSEEEMPLAGSQDERVLLSALDEATDLVVAYLECPESASPPGAVVRVTARVAMRGFIDEPMYPGSDAEVNLMGPFSHSISWNKEVQARDFYLTDSDRMRLDPYRCSGGGRVIHVAMATAADDSDIYSDTQSFDSWYLDA